MAFVTLPQAGAGGNIAFIAKDVRRISEGRFDGKPCVWIAFYEGQAAAVAAPFDEVMKTLKPTRSKK